MTRLTKKRLLWVMAVVGFPFNAALGDWHHTKFGGHAWKADGADRADKRRGGRPA